MHRIDPVQDFSFRRRRLPRNQRVVALRRVEDPDQARSFDVSSDGEQERNRDEDYAADEPSFLWSA